MLQEEVAKLETSVNAAAADDGQQATPMLAAHPIVKCLTKDSYPCPFCRRALPKTDDEIVSVLQKRMDLQDPQAYFNMAGYAREGLHGVARDEQKAVSLLERAAALGSAEACSDLFLCYLLGLCGVEQDSAKARALLIRAAKGGLAQARHNLATLEYESGQIDAAIRHLKISTASGYKLSLESMEELRDEGHISDDEYNKAVADVVAAQKEEHTAERTAARKLRDIKALP